MHQLNMYSFSKALQSRWTAGSSRWVVQKALPQLLQRRWLGSQGGEQSPTHPANSHCLRRFNFKCWRTEIFPCSATRRASYSLQACSIQKPLLSEHDLLLALMSLFLYLPLAVLPKVCVGAEGRCRSCPQRLVACTGAACSPLPSHQIGLIVSKTRMATSSTQVFRAIGLKIYVFLWQWIIEGLVASRHCLKSLFWSMWRFMDRLSKSWNMLSSGGPADLAANTRLRVLRPFLATEMYSWGSSKWSGGFYFFFLCLLKSHILKGMYEIGRSIHIFVLSLFFQHLLEGRGCSVSFCLLPCDWILHSKEMHFLILILDICFWMIISMLSW